MDNDKLTLIVANPADPRRENSGVDWWQWEDARERMRVFAVMRILRRYGSPPDLQPAAVKLVIKQVEAMVRMIQSDEGPRDLPV